MPTEDTTTKLDAISVAETAAKYLQVGLPLSIRDDLHWQPNKAGQTLRQHLAHITAYELVGVKRERLWPYGVVPGNTSVKEPQEGEAEVRTGVRYELEVLTRPEYVRPVELEATLQIEGLQTEIVSAANSHELCHFTKTEDREVALELNGKSFQLNVPGTEMNSVSKTLLVRTSNLCPEKDVGAGNYQQTERWTPRNAVLAISSGDESRAPLMITYTISDEHWDRISILKDEIDAYARQNGFPESDWPYYSDWPFDEEEVSSSASTWSTIVPNGWYCVSFEQARRNHNRCYMTLGSDRGECDKNFQKNLVDVCWKYIMRPWKQSTYVPTASDMDIYHTTATLTGRADLLLEPPIAAIRPSLFFPIPAHLQPQALRSLRHALLVAEIYYLAVRATGGEYHRKSQELARKYKDLVDEFIANRYS